MMKSIIIGAACFLIGITSLVFAQSTGLRPDQFVALPWVWTAVQQFSKAVGVALTTPTISTATFTLDLTQGQDFKVVLVHASCPCTINFSNPPAYPVHGVLEIVQSSTGSDTVGTWGAAGPTVLAGGGVTTLVLSTSANAKDFFSYDSYDGSNVLVVLAALAASH
jgi:hypothetical protein